MIAHGANINAVDRWRGTSLRDAEAGGHTAVVKYLKLNGAKQGAAAAWARSPAERKRSNSWGSFSGIIPSPRRLTKKKSMPVLPLPADDPADAAPGGGHPPCVRASFTPA